MSGAVVVSSVKKRTGAMEEVRERYFRPELHREEVAAERGYADTGGGSGTTQDYEFGDGNWWRE